MNELIESVEESEKQIADLERKITEIISQYGSAEEIKGKIIHAEEQVIECDRKLKEIDVQSRLVEDAIESLRIATKSVCPVCNQPIEIGQTLKRLEEESRRHLGEEVAKLNQEKTRFEKQCKDSGETLKNLEELSKKKKESANSQNESIGKLERARACRLPIDL